MPNIDGSKTPIFDALAEDLNSVGEGNGDEIMCPMCLRRFGRTELKALTKEHVLSKALGGAALVLTCKDCNNSAGHKVQGHLKTLLQMNEGFRGDGHFVGRFTVFGETVPVGVELKPGTGLLVTPRGGSPQSLAKIQNGLKAGGSTKWSAQFKVPYSPGKASAGIARAAYLAAFFRFGYEYILSGPSRLLCSEVISAMDKHSDRLCLLTGKGGSGLSPIENGPEAVIAPIELEDGFRFFLAMMRFQRNRDYWMFCVLPVQTQPCETMFTDLQKAAALLGMYNLQMRSDESGEIEVKLLRHT